MASGACRKLKGGKRRRTKGELGCNEMKKKKRKTLAGARETLGVRGHRKGKGRGGSWARHEGKRDPGACEESTGKTGMGES